MKGISWKEAKRRLLDNPEFVLELEKTEPEFQTLRQLIRLRKLKKISQQVLAERTGMRQSHIARLESGEIRPSIVMLKRYANGLGYALSLNIVPKEEYFNEIKHNLADLNSIEYKVVTNKENLIKHTWTKEYKSDEIIPDNVVYLEKLGAA